MQTDGRKRGWAERTLEAGLFSARWLLAPFYVGLVVAVLLLLVVFVRELWVELTHLAELEPRHGVLAAMSLIDLSLAANLVLIVIFAGYENFVARMDVPAGERPAWMGAVDFGGLKRKIIASIVVISAVALLRVFVDVADSGGPVPEDRVKWLVAVHLTFVVSGVLMALMDWLTSRSGEH
jgi:uncharacterized protein (TIGR00645 family)